LKSKPKKPLNAYFKFRQEKLIEYHADEDRNTKVKTEWDGIDTKEKDKLES
jgi:hypothetical protein